MFIHYLLRALVGLVSHRAAPPTSSLVTLAAALLSLTSLAVALVLVVLALSLVSAFEVAVAVVVPLAAALAEIRLTFAFAGAVPCEVPPTIAQIAPRPSTNGIHVLLALVVVIPPNLPDVHGRDVTPRLWRHDFRPTRRSSRVGSRTTYRESRSGTRSRGSQAVASTSLSRSSSHRQPSRRIGSPAS